jgi:CheY-like chemotaxis protein
VEVTPRPVVSPVAGSPVQRPLRVLLVDDNAINRLLGERLLVREGHSVRVSSDGVDALALLEAGRFDVILMDVQMPTLDGLEVTRRLRARGDRTPVIALTANAVLGVREACLEAGMNDYVAKPIELVTLRAALLRLTSPAPGGGE